MLIIKISGSIRLCLGLFVLLFIPVIIWAHCDTMNGPVVKAAQKALETGNVSLVLIWVQPKDEAVIREAFNKTLAVRKQSPQAKELADMYFFETLVRIHRAGEGAAYTGLKPADAEIEPGIEAADKALEVGSIDQLMHDLIATIDKETQRHFNEAISKKNYKQSDLDAGRAYVHAYVEFIHYVERLHESAVKPVEEHGD